MKTFAVGQFVRLKRLMQTDITNTPILAQEIQLTTLVFLRGIRGVVQEYERITKYTSQGKGSTRYVYKVRFQLGDGVLADTLIPDYMLTNEEGEDEQQLAEALY